MQNMYTAQQFKEMFFEQLKNYFTDDLASATDEQIYRTLAAVVRKILSEKHQKFVAKTYGENSKQVYYLCMEFLLGRSLKTNLHNLGITKIARDILSDVKIDLGNIFDQEPDAGLGNGGLGRLSACYLDGMASTSIPATGFSILYEYGIFKQEIVDGWQVEKADNWLPGGSVWLKRHADQAIEVRFDGEIEESWSGQYHTVKHKNYTSVMAVPSDMYVSGYDTNGVSQLRLWEAKAPGLDMESFNRGDYTSAMSANSSAELISKVLYPNDNHTEVKILRLRQQYFLSAASIGEIVSRHLAQYGKLSNLPDKVAIQLNDTHPTLAIPELMRILLDECGYQWSEAFDICSRTFAYTNHTVMSEALEQWDISIFKKTLPRIYMIVEELDKQARVELHKMFLDDIGKVNYMAVLGDDKVRMANICCYTCHSINGVSKLHSEIIKDDVFNDYFIYTPNKFKNVTNGIAYRRWLLQSNPLLTKFIDDAIGDGYKYDAAELKNLEKLINNKSALKKLEKIKLENKITFANHLKKTTGQIIDPTSIFDVQVKRMHEYKRQHLNAINILSEYIYLKNNPNAPFVPKTYIFGAKAAPGYYMAKQMIRFICSIGKLIESDPRIKEKLRIVYLEDYNVTTSERLMPASEVSEQISLAGTEASGTGNMKFMLNGAITIGTLDGANVEIAHAAGLENEVIFGMTTPEVKKIRQFGYHPSSFIASDDRAIEILNFCDKGWNGETFREISDNLRSVDYFMVMADFVEYRKAQAKVSELYQDRTQWNKMSLMNIANSGMFSADRSVLDYSRDIWNTFPVK